MTDTLASVRRKIRWRGLKPGDRIWVPEPEFKALVIELDSLNLVPANALALTSLFLEGVQILWSRDLAATI